MLGFVIVAMHGGSIDPGLRSSAFKFKNRGRKWIGSLNRFGVWNVEGFSVQKKLKRYFWLRSTKNTFFSDF